MCSQLSYEYSQLCFVVHVLFNRLCLKLLHEHRQLHFATKLQIHNTLRQNYETKTRRAESGQFTATPVSGQTINIQKVAHTRTHISFYIYIYIYVAVMFLTPFVPDMSARHPRTLSLTFIIGGSCHKHHFRRDETFLATKHLVCRGKSMLAATKVLSRHNYTCLSVATSFVTTGILLLSKQKT